MNIFDPKTWEIQRVFLKSEHGYTPLMLADQPSGRQWGVFMRQAGLSQREMIKNGSQMFLDFNWGLWTHNGESLSGAMALDWITTGCQCAATLEELFEINPGLKFTVKYTSMSNGTIKRRTIKTTSTLDYILEDSGGQKISPKFSGVQTLSLPNPDPLYDSNRLVVIPIKLERARAPLYFFSEKTTKSGADYLLTYKKEEALKLSERDATEIAIKIERRGTGKACPFETVQPDADSMEEEAA